MYLKLLFSIAFLTMSTSPWVFAEETASSVKANAKEDLQISKILGEKCGLLAPKGWECITDPEQLPQKILRIYIGKAKNQFTPSLNIACEDTESSIEEYVKLAREYHESQTNVHCKSLGTIESKSGPMRLLQIDSPTQWGTVRFLQAILIKKAQAYVITATSLQEEFSTFSAQFLRSIQTFFIEE